MTKFLRRLLREPGRVRRGEVGGKEFDNLAVVAEDFAVEFVDRAVAVAAEEGGGCPDRYLVYRPYNLSGLLL